MNLTLLAPDLQEPILELEAIGGIEPSSERKLRHIVRHESWTAQRHAWSEHSDSAL